MDRGFEYVDHTADVGIRAWGPTLEIAFAESARGMIAHMVDVTEARAVGAATLVIDAESIERLLYRFLDEVLDLLQSQLYVTLSATVRFEGDTRLVAEIEGEAYDAKRHGHVHEIKAITFHDLHVRRAPPEVFVIVDI